MRLPLFLCLLSLLCWSPAHSQNRKALLISVSDYEHWQQLPNARNDTALLEKSLKKSGFSISRVHNPTEEKIKSSMDSFMATLAADDLAMIYFAGHGMQTSGTNLLITRKTPAPGENGAAPANVGWLPSPVSRSIPSSHTPRRQTTPPTIASAAPTPPSPNPWPPPLRHVHHKA